VNAPENGDGIPTPESKPPKSSDGQASEGATPSAEVSSTPPMDTNAKTEDEVIYEVNEEFSQIRIDDKLYDVSGEAARMAKLLLDNETEWVSMKNHGFTKPSEVKKKLPEAVLNLIETEKGKGYRLKPRR